ncbi:MAG: S8 family serine peptidase [Candidatus Nanopelagicales bacterium]
MHGGRRPIVAAAAAVLLAGLAATQLPSPAHAEDRPPPSPARAEDRPLASRARTDDGPLPGATLVVPATDVTSTDRDLGSTAREVVVVSAGTDGPQITKLRTRNAQDARTLAADLDAQPGLSAELNSAVSVPAPAASPQPGPPASPHPGASGRPNRVGLPAHRTLGAAALPRLATEPLGPEQWGLRMVNAEAAWAITRGRSVTVAVIDTGVDAAHPDLSGRVLRQIDLVHDGRLGDPKGHGTHVAGIIAAALDGAGSVGLANQVDVLSVRVLDASGSGDDATVALGITEAVRAGARVLNLSLGSASHSTALNAAVKFAVDQGATVVAAGGNSFEAGNPVEYPAALPGVLAVSSIDADGASSRFANTGAHIDLAAPGEDIVSTVPGGGWAAKDGTSMAAPFVSAAAALVRAANPTLSRVAVDSALVGTALDDNSGDGRDDWFGYGLIRADRAALRAALAPGGLRAPEPAPLPRASVKVKTTGSRSKLFVDVDPNKGSGYWSFQVQSARADGSWRALKTYRTHGRSETRTLDLKKGTYRVVVAAKYGYRGTTSASVHLKK